MSRELTKLEQWEKTLNEKAMRQAAFDHGSDKLIGGRDCPVCGSDVYFAQTFQRANKEASFFRAQYKEALRKAAHAEADLAFLTWKTRELESERSQKVSRQKRALKQAYETIERLREELRIAHGKPTSSSNREPTASGPSPVNAPQEMPDRLPSKEAPA